MEKFDIREILKGSDISILKAIVTFQDRRNGKVYSKNIYRPEVISYVRVAQELDKYGYELISITNTEKIEGAADWAASFWDAKRGAQK